jgi:nucleotide-binding universal stress UspA family protein
MRLLVGVDGRDGGRDAAALARVLAVGDPESSVVAVMNLYTGPFPMEYALLEGEEEKEARPTLDEARQILGDVEVETRAFGGGSTAAIFTTLAEREEFDAMVVGSSHWGPVGQVLIGSTTKSLLNGASCEVFVAPKGYSQEDHSDFRVIAVGYDGTPESKAALQRAEHLAHRSNATIKVMTVVEPPVIIPGPAGGYAPPAPRDPDPILNDAVHSVDKSSLAAERVRLDGAPAEALADACKDVDLLVLGSRGYGPIARVFLGSVSREVAKHTPCPMLVIPRSGQDI